MPVSREQSSTAFFWFSVATTLGKGDNGVTLSMLIPIVFVSAAFFVVCAVLVCAIVRKISRTHFDEEECVVASKFQFSVFSN